MKHLDLGCGLFPKNPYSADELFGCDVRDIEAELKQKGVHFKAANLVVEPIPFPDNTFDSISAMDFLEHIPRQIIDANGLMKNAFVDLMNEIYRVLKPNGIFFASTPIYPHPWAFIDPTHVNIMTDQTYTYFIGNQSHGRMYGVYGNFEKITARWETPNSFKDFSEPNYKKQLRRFHRRFFRGGLSHQLLELKAIK